eukprot:TRINITY_DN3276_c0_g1_i1.p1 TRINITY_DN3276_c0_g1~~TRINITY_DN3276_c0_g1_i1.p1  ORF type:complete len:481 (-),score=111.42 TRINITY_DN3276_c0_g1_i1:45-1487(-)
MSTFQIGDSYPVPMKMHEENRSKILGYFEQDAIPNSAIVINGGEQQTRYSTDHEPLFRQEEFFQYLFGVKEPDCFGAILVNSAESILFVPRHPDFYATWLGPIHPTDVIKEQYEVDHCYYTDEIAETLKKFGVNNLYLLQGVNTDSHTTHEPAKFEGIEDFEQNLTDLYDRLVECRVCKSGKEIDLMRFVCRLSAEAHCEVMKRCKPGMFEYQLEAIFKHYAFEHGGCRNVGYTCICGSGPHAAYLHYGHAAEPNNKQIEEGDVCLLDMGAEYHCYGADITRTYPMSGVWTDDQKEVYTIVLRSADAVMNAIKPGVNYKDMHMLSERVMLEGMVEFGFLVGDVQEMMDAHLASIFMPHGLGHLLGLCTHDVGGYPPGVERSERPGLRSLRLGRDLKEGMVLTIEPGLYFNLFTLPPAFDDPKLSKFLVKEKLDKFMDFGGVRIEDNVVVTSNGCENLSGFAPRTIEEIEQFMKEHNPNVR